MSEWVTKSEKDGSKVTIVADKLPFIFIITILLTLLIFSQPLKFYFICVSIATAGFIMFFISKVSVFKIGRFMSFGTKGMKPIFKHLYYIGYFFMIFSCIGFIGLILVNLTLQ